METLKHVSNFAVHAAYLILATHYLIEVWRYLIDRC
jgi:hypothetical protein